MQIANPELTLSTSYTMGVMVGDMNRIVSDLTAIYGLPTFETRIDPQNLAHAEENTLLGETDFSSVHTFPKGPTFMLTAHHAKERTGVEFPELNSAGNAAARAALWLYLNKQPLPKEVAEQPNWLLIYDNAGELSQGLRQKEGRNSRWRIPSPQGIEIKHRKREQLPGQLLEVAEMFKTVLPHRAREASVVVGRMVGARNIEVFCSAWAVAAEKEDPAMAARTLLENPHVWLDN